MEYEKAKSCSEFAYWVNQTNKKKILFFRFVCKSATYIYIYMYIKYYGFSYLQDKEQYKWIINKTEKPYY